MDPKAWGTSAWKFLHAVTFAYPENPSTREQAAAEALFDSLRLLLPCDDCKTHFGEIIDTRAVDTSSRQALSAWLVDAHNRVNEKLGKPRFSYDAFVSANRRDVCTSGCSGRAVDTKDPVNRLMITCFIVLGLLALYWLVKYRSNVYDIASRTYRKVAERSAKATSVVA